MTESNQRANQEEAILQLMVEFRNLFLAQQEMQPEPTPSPPPPPRRRVRIAAVLLAGVAAVALGYIGSTVWERFGALQRLVSSADGRAAVAPPQTVVAEGTPPGATAVPDAPAPERVLSTAVAPGAPVVTPRTPAATPGAPAVTPHPITLAQTPAADGYHVQVGAFNVLEYARDMIHQLRARDYSVTLVEAPAGPPHRVWIAGVFDQSAAARMVNRLRSDGFEAIVVRE